MRRNYVGMYINWLISIVFNVIVVVLFLRFIFKLFAANTGADIVEFLYNSTQPLLEPFQSVFTPYSIESGSVLEFSTLLAIVVYSLVAWLIVELVDFITYSATKSYRRID
jgi:uncharacterized protein YggT (Ycf19 family)